MANKSAFIRSLPRSMPASEVVKKGKAAGMSFSDKYVYTIRSKGPKAGKRGRPKGSGRKARASGGAGAQQFVDLAIELGLSRAEALLARLRSAIKSAAIG
jgi:hypothetical protein